MTRTHWLLFAGWLAFVAGALASKDAEPKKAADAAAAAPAVHEVVLPESPRETVLANVAGKLTQAHTLEADPSAPDALVAPSASAGLSARDGDKVLEFPLEHTRVNAQVSGNIARVELTQLYKNPGTTRLEAVYQFPLPPNAAVTDMYFRIGNRIVYSVVDRKEQARRTYEQARAEGKAAALTEQERPNLFTQSVANIPPGEAVAVVIRYVHEVPYDSGRYVFHVPTTIGPRYIPGPRADGTARVADAGRITPPVIGPAFRGAHDIDITVRLSPGAAFTGLASRNHRVVSGMDGEGGQVVALAEDDRRPNKDFVLSYRPAGARPRAHALVERERGDDYLMLFVQPPANVADELIRPKELVFLLDKSGSMSGAPLDTSIALVKQALRRMGKDDTFQIVAFDGAAYAMSHAPLSNTAENVRRADRWLSSLSGGGGTEMLQGIIAALSPSEDPARLRMVVFCTDAYIGNEEEILSAIRERRKQARVFAFGIGSSVNRYLIEGMAREGRGAADYVAYREAPEVAVDRLYARLDKPLLTDLELEFEGLDVTDIQPQHLPDLFAGQPLVIVGKYSGAASGAVVVKGRLGRAAYRERIPIETTAAKGPNAVLGTLWARRRIDHLMFLAPGSPSPDVVEDVVALGLKFKLVTQFTSFVAVEQELRTDPGVPLTTVLVPNELPEGVSAEGIFGEAAATQAVVLPNRVKPGDPELRVKAPQTAVSVKVRLPFDFSDREATFDPRTQDYVLRFLVPSGWPDGSYDAVITIRHSDGRSERKLAPIKVDTAAPSVVVTHASPLRAGEALELRFKPALSLGEAATLATSGRQGGAAEALKAAIDVKEVLVRAPWGEVAVAKMQGGLGEYVATLNVPYDWQFSSANLEVVASDAAGNVRRSALTAGVGSAAAMPLWIPPLAVLAALAFAVLLMRWARSRRVVAVAAAPHRAVSVDSWV